MRKKKSILTMFCVVLCLTTVLSACKKEEKNSEQKTIYKATEYILTDRADSNKAAFGNSAVYYVSKDNKLSKYEIETKTETELPISFEEKEQVLQLDCTDKEELIVLTILEDNGLFSLALYDKDGKEIWKKDVTDHLKDKDPESHFYLTVDAEGNIYLLNGFYHVSAWNKLGEFQFVLRSDYMTSGIAAVKDNVYTYSRDTDKHFLQKIDYNKQKWEMVKGKDVPDASGFNGCILGGDVDGEFFVNIGNSLVTCDLKRGNSETVLSWTDYGMVAETILAWEKKGEDFHCISADESRVKLVILSPAKEGEAVEKQVVTIGEVGTHGYIESAISEFNRRSDKYTIQLVTYEGNALAGIKRQDLDLMAGNGPDILCMGTEKYRKYADRGLLEELDTYFEQDEEIGKEDFLPNIVAAYERNRKIYGMTTDFAIETIAMPTKYAGDKIGVTTDEFIEIVNNIPKDKKLHPFFEEKKYIFRFLLGYSYQEFINFDDYTCDFDGEEFIEWITFINSIETGEKITDFSEVALEDYVLATRGISDITAYQYEKAYFKGEEITFLGYPGRSDCGSVISNSVAVGINSQSKSKEGAWEFIKFLLSEERQDSMLESELALSRFPVRKSTLEKGFEKAMEPEYEMDENGNQVEIPKATYLPSSKEEIKLYAATEEDIEKMRELITSVNTFSEGNGSPICEIIMEEVAAFYEGDKSAEEVAGLIQNRVETYLNETK